MPLLDHFKPPFGKLHPWHSFHGTWAVAIARLLNTGGLPEGYYALPFINRDGPVEIDVAAFRAANSGSPVGIADGTRTWSPSAPGLAVAVDWPDTDHIGVDIYSNDGDPHFMAAIELVSPSNKDRTAEREAFAAKNADHLRMGRSVVIVDAVTTRRADLHADILEELGVVPNEPIGPIYAVSYRSVGRNGSGQLFIWPFPLEIGKPLPTLPLWLGYEISVPLDLEESHAAACEDLGIGRIT